MESNYYTPDISEFYVGFEYEKKMASGKFKQKNAIAFDMKTIQDYLETYQRSLESGYGKIHGHKFVPPYRVKYLDREDIESLGFIDNKLEWKNKVTRIKQRSETHAYDIACFEPKSPIAKLKAYGFSGIIKNLSELKRILKQIGYEQENETHS